MSVFPLGTLPTEKQRGRCSPHCSFGCCDPHGSEHQAGQVTVPNPAPPAPTQVPLASGDAGAGVLV